MKQLIVNADDYGADHARNEGIVEGLAAGVITGVSILANGPSFAEIRKCFASFSRNAVSWGLHINLSEGKPVSSSLPLLTGPDGYFRGKESARQLLEKAGHRRLEGEVRREIQAQIDLLRQSGIPVSHLDGHQHVHIFPAVIRAALDGAEKNGIPWIRLPEEPPPIKMMAKDRLLCVEAARFSFLAKNARPYLSASRVRVPHHFRGLYLKDRLTPRRLFKILAMLPEGLTELMVHPGRVSAPPLSGALCRLCHGQEVRGTRDPVESRLSQRPGGK